MSANGKLIVDNKTGKNVSTGKDEKTGEFLKSALEFIPGLADLIG